MKFQTLEDRIASADTNAKVALFATAALALIVLLLRR